MANSLSHLSVGSTNGYNPGMLTAGLISLPLSLWVAYACFIKGEMRWLGMIVLTVAGAILSVILLASIKLFVQGHLSAPALITIQALNPLCVILIPWLFENRVLRPTRGH